MRIFNNLLYKIVALLVACVLWSVAQGFKSVEDSLDVPIEIQKLASDLVVVDQSVEFVNMRIAGSRAAVRGARKDPVRYAVSLEGVKAGNRTFPVTREHFASLRRGARVLAHAPSTVSFQIEPVTRKEVPVRVELAGEPAEGYRVISVVVSPERIEIAGASREIRRLRELKTEAVEVSRQSQSFTEEAELVAASEHVWVASEELRGQPVSVTVSIGPKVVKGGSEGIGAGVEESE